MLTNEILVTATMDVQSIRRLQPWTRFAREFSNIWPSEASARHFLRTRREAMQKRGILIRTTTGFLVDAQRLIEALPALMATATEKESTLHVQRGHRV